MASYDVRALNHVICFLRFQSLHFWSYFLGNMMIKFLPLYLRQHSWNFWNFVAVTSKFRPKIMSLFSLLRQNLTMMTANFCCNKNAFLDFFGAKSFASFIILFSHLLIWITVFYVAKCLNTEQCHRDNFPLRAPEKWNKKLQLMHW